MCICVFRSLIIQLSAMTINNYSSIYTYSPQVIWVLISKLLMRLPFESPCRSDLVTKKLNKAIQYEAVYHPLYCSHELSEGFSDILICYRPVYIRLESCYNSNE